MRNRALLVAALICTAAHAQNWALLNPAYRYNYSNDGTDTISNQIRVMDVDTLGVDSFRYELNLIAKVCDTCTAPGLFLLLNQPQFMQREVIAGTTVWHFHDPGSFVILPLANLGESWTFDTLMNITATVTAIDLTQVFGNDVQGKVISLSNGDSIVLSEPFGILSWSGHELIGVHGPDVGELLPSLEELFPYTAGDVVEYAVSEGGFNGLNGYEGNHRFYKFTIDIGTLLPSSIAYSGQYLEHRYGWYDPDGGSQITFGHQTTYGSTWVAGAPEFPWSDLQVSYPGQLVHGFVHPNQMAPDSVACIAMHWINEAGVRMIGCKPICYPGCTEAEWTLNFWLPQTFDPTAPVQYFPAAYYSPFSPGYCDLQYEAGLGFKQYLGCYFEWGESYRLGGAVINGDTTGIVHSDEFLIALAVDEADTVPGTFVPNPANDRIKLANAAIGSTARITDLNGRIVLAHPIASANQVIDVVALRPGAYLLVVEGSAPQRFMIVR